MLNVFIPAILRSSPIVTHPSPDHDPPPSTYYTIINRPGAHTGGGGSSPTLAIRVCAAVQITVFRPFGQEKGKLINR